MKGVIAMYSILAESGVSISSALTDFTSVLTSVIGVVTGNPILLTMFAGGLLAVGAKVFKKIKNASK